MYDADGKLLNGIKSVCVNGLTFLSVKKGVRESISEKIMV